MPRRVEEAAREMISSVMNQSGSRVIDVDPIVEELGRLYPEFTPDDILQRVISAVTAVGGAVSWGSKH